MQRWVRWPGGELHDRLVEKRLDRNSPKHNHSSIFVVLRWQQVEDAHGRNSLSLVLVLENLSGNSRENVSLLSRKWFAILLRFKGALHDLTDHGIFHYGFVFFSGLPLELTQSDLREAWNV